ncbi:MAG: hypothetical protein CMJ51_02810 [Planctomycetaceae bacterium]|nr:hypothetical protein [Planctomycetaceae bacterium]
MTDIDQPEDSDVNTSADSVPEPADVRTELDELAAAVRVKASPETLGPLWTATMNLERWFFPGVGAFPNLRPFSGLIDEEPYVMAFTVRARAERYAHTQNLVPEGSKPAIMSFPVVEAAKLCTRQHERGARWVVFDDGWAGWRFPLQQLAAIVNKYHVPS